MPLAVPLPLSLSRPAIFATPSGLTGKRGGGVRPS